MLQAGLFLFLTRAVTPDEFGLFSAALATAVVVYAVIDFGMSSRFLRAAADENPEQFAGFSLIARAASLLATLVAALLVLSAGNEEWTAIVISALLLGIGESFGESSVAALQGRQRSVNAAVAILLRRTAALAILLAMPDISGLLYATAASAGVGITTFAMAVIPVAGRPISLARFARANSPFALASAGPQLAQFDSVIIASTSGMALAGLYSPATRLMNPINVAVLSLMQVFIPELSSIGDPEQRLAAFRRARRAILPVAGVIGVLATASPWVTDLLFDDRYSASAPIVGAVFICAALSGVAQIHVAWFISTTTPLSVPIGMIAASLLGLATMAILGPVFGVWGLAVALVIMHAGVTCVILVIFRLATRGDRRRR